MLEFIALGREEFTYILQDPSEAIYKLFVLLSSIKQMFLAHFLIRFSMHLFKSKNLENRKENFIFTNVV